MVITLTRFQLTRNVGHPWSNGARPRSDMTPAETLERPRPAFRLRVNGIDHPISLDRDRSLLYVLREELGLTGTKYGCGEGECGACKILVDGVAVRSCQTPIGEVVGRSVTTIEGLAQGARLHPVQQAFIDAGAFQCGFCTPGMIMAAVSLLARAPHPSDGEICAAMDGNLCRCGGYLRIVEAVRKASRTSDGAGGGPP
jgi:aerobic-type carbon monoxide dehydrogenase small subunit (CoxS/CutS family)